MRHLVRVLTFVLLAAASASASPQWFEEFIPSHGRLGVQLQGMTPELREYLHAPADRGVLVVRVNEDSAADKAGVRVGDVIVAAGGEPVRETREIVHAVMRAEQDAKLALEVVRDGKTRTLEATLTGEPFSPGELIPDGVRGPLRNFERALPEFREQFEKRIDELERRLQELEKKLEGELLAKPERKT